VGLRAGLDRCGKSRLHRDFFFVKRIFINPISYTSTTDSSWHSARYTNSTTGVVIERSPQAV
jgi:hypothetical protein